jgi:hypothetical protein
MSVELPLKVPLDSKGVDKLITLLAKAGKEAGMTEREIKEMNDEIVRTGKESDTHVNKLNNNLNNLVNNGLKKVGAAFLAAFAVDRLMQVGKEIVNITAEFQKMEAVLTNTLGSRSAAKIAIKQIEEFAARTPFSVAQLTASFVKLANQGFVPTQEEMRKLGDLASSTGKDFDQLAEAIIDAQTGEFERLKEFGVRAKKEGDNVIFTFKGVETQTKFTADAMRDYVVSLGDAVGVSGSMSAISGTLGGQISNLGDSWDKLLKTLGDAQKGPLKQFVNGLIKLIEMSTEAAKTQEQLREELETAGAAKAVENLKVLARTYGDVQTAATDYLKMLTIARDAEFHSNMRMSRLDENLRDDIDASNDKIAVLKAMIQAVKDYAASEAAKAEIEKNATKITKEDTKEKKKNNDERKRAININNLLAQSLLQVAMAHNAEAAAKKKGQEEISDFLNDIYPVDQLPDKVEMDNEYTRAYIDNIKKRQNAEWQAAEEKEMLREAEKEAALQSLDLAIMLTDHLMEYQQITRENELASIRSQQEYELSMAGDNADARGKINKKYADKERALKNKQAQDEKQQALYRIGIETAVGVIKTIANLGLPVAAPFIALTLATGLIQGAIVQSRPVPKFKDGVFKLKGPGSTTSDSINAMLSRDESVVPAAASNKFSDLVQRVVEDPSTTWADLKQIVDSKIPSRLRGDLFNGKVGTDSKRVEEKLDKLIDTVANKRETHINIDEDGFQNWTRKGDNWTHYVGKRYSA